MLTLNCNRLAFLTRSLKFYMHYPYHKYVLFYSIRSELHISSSSIRAYKTTLYKNWVKHTKMNIYNNIVKKKKNVQVLGDSD